MRLGLVGSTGGRSAWGSEAWYPRHIAVVLVCTLCHGVKGVAQECWDPAACHSWGLAGRMSGLGMGMGLAAAVRQHTGHSRRNTSTWPSRLVPLCDVGRAGMGSSTWKVSVPRGGTIITRC